MELQRSRQSLAELVPKIDEKLADLIEFSTNAGLPLDYSVESLDYLEIFLADFADNGDSEVFQTFQDECWMYLGQVICKQWGGHWEISEDKDNYPDYYGLPVVTDFNAYADEICPIELISVFVETREEGFLKAFLGKYFPRARS